VVLDGGGVVAFGGAVVAGGRDVVGPAAVVLDELFGAVVNRATPKPMTAISSSAAAAAAIHVPIRRGFFSSAASATGAWCCDPGYWPGGYCDPGYWAFGYCPVGYPPWYCWASYGGYACVAFGGGACGSYRGS
jgi:hypothetical protein